MYQFLKVSSLGLVIIKALEYQKKEIENQISKTKNYVKNLYEDKVNGIITALQFKDLVTEYNKNEDMYNDQLVSIYKEVAYYKMKSETSKNHKDLFSKYKKINKLNRVVVEEFIDKIYIGKINEETNERDIKIKWNFE